MTRLRVFVLAATAALILFGGVRMWQEANYGTGAQANADALDEPAREIAFVANAVEGTISLIDVADRNMIRTLDIVPDGKRVGFFRDPLQSLAQGYVEGQAGLNLAQDTDLSRDGRVLFVSRAYLGDVAAFDLASGNLLWRTPVSGVRADHMALSPDGKRLYVSTLIFSGDEVNILDTETGAHIDSFAAGRWPHDFHVSKDGARLFTASLGDMLAEPDERRMDPDAYLVTVQDAKTLERLATHTFEAGIRPFVVTEDESQLYAQLSLTHSIVARDLNSGQQTDRIDLPVADGTSEEDWDFDAPHHGLAMTADELLLCAAGRASDYAAIVSAPDLELRATVPTGDAPSWAVMTSDDRFCLTPNTRSDDVSFVDMAGATEAARVAVGQGPKHISIGQVPLDVLAVAPN